MSCAQLDVMLLGIRDSVLALVSSSKTSESVSTCFDQFSELTKKIPDLVRVLIATNLSTPKIDITSCRLCPFYG